MFSIVISSWESEKSAENTINSLTGQILDFEKNIEVIILGNSHDNSEKIYEKYCQKFPNNFKYINDSNLASAKNIALDIARGEYINFLECGDTLSKNTLKDVSATFDNNANIDLVSISIYSEGNPLKEYDNDDVIDLYKFPQYYQVFGKNTFIKIDCVKNIKFPQIITSQETVVANEVLINNPNMGICGTSRLDSIKDSDTDQLKREFYTERCNSYFRYLIGRSLEKYQKVPDFIQNTILHDLNEIINVENITDILDKSEIADFKNSLNITLTHIDDENIMGFETMDDDSKLKSFLLKYGELKKEITGRFNLNTVFIDVYEIINDELYVLANIQNLNDENVDTYINGRKIDSKRIRFPQRDKCCIDIVFSKDNSFEFRLPLNKEKKYEIIFKQKDFVLDIDFSRPCNFSKVIGYAKTRHYLSILKENRIVIEKKTSMKWLVQEAKTLARILKRREPGFHVGVPFRIAYMIGYPFLRNKHIWFYMDRPESGDDNGMHLFKYSIDKDPKIKKYFILDKNSKDYNKMSKIGNVLGFKSIRHRYLGMFAENIISSHPDNQDIYPFWGRYPFFAGLLKSNTIFLQHGIIKDDISSWLNKTNMNLSFFLTSAKMEYESIFKYPYHYGENVVQLLGLPRFDTLKNETDKKQVVIMPSWRRILTGKSDDYIKESEFFKRFNSLINNERLIEMAKKYDYEIIFRPHPKVYDFIELYDTNNHVKIDYQMEDYQTLFNNGSILITDYSSVAFDFAYLYKPVIYYQYGNDYHFDVEESFFNYETMGLGEICKNEDELVDLIIEYMKNDCKIKAKYHQRIRDFYLFTDRNNCKRVYDAIKEIPLKD